jgi:hypothetical protein
MIPRPIIHCTGRYVLLLPAKSFQESQISFRKGIKRVICHYNHADYSTENKLTGFKPEQTNPRYSRPKVCGMTFMTKLRALI